MPVRSWVSQLPLAQTFSSLLLAQSLAKLSPTLAIDSRAMTSALLTLLPVRFPLRLARPQQLFHVDVLAVLDALDDLAQLLQPHARLPHVPARLVAQRNHLDRHGPDKQEHDDEIRRRVPRPRLALPPRPVLPPQRLGDQRLPEAAVGDGRVRGAVRARAAGGRGSDAAMLRREGSADGRRGVLRRRRCRAGSQSLYNHFEIRFRFAGEDLCAGVSSLFVVLGRKV